MRGSTGEEIVNETEKKSEGNLRRFLDGGAGKMLFLVVNVVAEMGEWKTAKISTYLVLAIFE